MNIDWEAVALACAWVGFAIAVVSLIAIYKLREA